MAIKNSYVGFYVKDSRNNCILFADSEFDTLVEVDLEIYNLIRSMLDTTKHDYDTVRNIYNYLAFDLCIYLNNEYITIPSTLYHCHSLQAQLFSECEQLRNL